MSGSLFLMVIELDNEKIHHADNCTVHSLEYDEQNLTILTMQMTDRILSSAREHNADKSRQADQTCQLALTLMPQRQKLCDKCPTTRR